MRDFPKPIGDTPTKFTKYLKISDSTRKGLRRKVLDAWQEEEENSRYRYDVETCKNGKKVYLLRPTWLNKGLDFQINLEGFKSKSQEAPKHGDLISDLEDKSHEAPAKYKQLREMIDQVYGCVEPDEALKQYPSLTFKSGLPSDTLLKLIKWLFIEQDLTYWNNSGRRMFMNAIKRID
ncbi:MAG TPA: hypothetical protein VJO53_03460 [Candidatus Acidoferrales bacterium]|nr:hypothetical protein [Candidatus Acidoferrales bacterium]